MTRRFTIPCLDKPAGDNAARALVRHNGRKALNPNGFTTAPIHAPFEGAFVRNVVQLVPVYQAAKDSGGDNYATAQPAELAIVTRQLAAGAAELRDEIVDAWRQSTDITVGFPLVRVSDIEAGTVPVTRLTFGAD
jgi:hypothetical protein